MSKKKKKIIHFCTVNFKGIRFSKHVHSFLWVSFESYYSNVYCHDLLLSLSFHINIYGLMPSLSRFTVDLVLKLPKPWTSCSSNVEVRHCVGLAVTLFENPEFEFIAGHNHCCGLIGQSEGQKLIRRIMIRWYSSGS